MADRMIDALDFEEPTEGPGLVAWEAFEGEPLTAADISFQLPRESQSSSGLGLTGWAVAIVLILFVAIPAVLRQVGGPIRG